MKNWTKEQVMNLEVEDLRQYINHMLSEGYSLERLNKEKGIRRQTIRDRLKKHGYTYDKNTNSYIKSSELNREPQNKPQEKRKHKSEQMTLENVLERVNETYGDTNTSFDKSNIGMKPTSVIKKYNKIFDCSSELDKSKKVFVTELNDALNGELPCKDNYDKTRRKHRGLFISNEGIKINADVNGAYQIIKKVSPNLFDGVEGVGLHPFKVNIK